MKKDPISISHKRLVKSKQWKTCLGCHDFHGNHEMNLKTNVNEATSPKTLLDYFDTGISPYSKEKIVTAFKELPENEN